MIFHLRLLRYYYNLRWRGPGREHLREGGKEEGSREGRKEERQAGK